MPKVKRTQVEDAWVRNDVDDASTGKISANGFDAGSQIVTSVANPSVATDGANKAYVDAEIATLTAGLDWQNDVLDRDLTAPPGGESPGDRYIVASVASGAWTGQEDDIAEWNGSAWIFTTPSAATRTHVIDEVKDVRWNGSAWVLVANTEPVAISLQNFPHSTLSGSFETVSETILNFDGIGSENLLFKFDLTVADTAANVRLYDVTNAQVLAQVLNSVSTGIKSVGMSNIPAGNAKIEVQLNVNAGTEVEIAGASIVRE